MKSPSPHGTVRGALHSLHSFVAQFLSEKEAPTLETVREARDKLCESPTARALATGHVPTHIALCDPHIWETTLRAMEPSTRKSEAIVKEKEAAVRKSEGKLQEVLRHLTADKLTAVSAEAANTSASAVEEAHTLKDALSKELGAAWTAEAAALAAERARAEAAAKVLAGASWLGRESTDGQAKKLAQLAQGGCATASPSTDEGRACYHVSRILESADTAARAVRVSEEAVKDAEWRARMAAEQVRAVHRGVDRWLALVRRAYTRKGTLPTDEHDAWQPTLSRQIRAAADLVQEAEEARQAADERLERLHAEVGTATKEAAWYADWLTRKSVKELKKEALDRNDVRYGGRLGDDGGWQQLYEGRYWVQDPHDPNTWQPAPEKKSAEDRAAEKAAQEKPWSEDAAKAWDYLKDWKPGETPPPKAKAKAKARGH